LTAKLTMLETYVERILKAKVYDVAVETALDAAPRLSRRLGNRVYFKREDLQPVFSFKIRGAYNKIAQLSPIVAQRGVICASAGNHAQGVALAARTRGIPALRPHPTSRFGRWRTSARRSSCMVTITIRPTSMPWD
jgi:threonine dehydratase